MRLEEISIHEFYDIVEEQIEFGDVRPILALGPAGIGKTEGIEALCERLNIGYKECRLITMSETDLMGVPHVIEVETSSGPKKKTAWAPNDGELFPDPDRDPEVGVLVLDEITSAQPNVRGAALQLLDKKRSINGVYKLPDKWLVVAMGNDEGDGGVYNGLEGVVINRCLCLRPTSNLDDWKKWAYENDVNTSVLAFVTSRPDFLHMYKDEEELECFPSPRSWTDLSRKLNDRERKKGGILDDRVVRVFASGTVGPKVAPEFAAFYKLNNELLNVSNIIDGKWGKKERTILDASSPNAEGVAFLTIQSLMNTLKIVIDKDKSKYGGNGDSIGGFSKEAYKKVGLACKWVVEQNTKYGMNLDTAVMFFQDIMNVVPDFTVFLFDDQFDKDYPEVIAFATDNSNIFSND